MTNGADSALARRAVLIEGIVVSANPIEVSACPVRKRGFATAPGRFAEMDWLTSYAEEYLGLTRH
jgi:hypothetical protein